ncbi:MAG TPA: phosphoglycolate phosphatase, partial [Candidatus Competibacteraceae bacterium]|nr:phosphoglycolate phosphatase [Candidatus Competibacteraceae bacterium]
MFQNITALFFDLDGTLVDSVPDLTAAVNVMLRQLGLP